LLEPSTKWIDMSDSEDDSDADNEDTLKQIGKSK
jgi:hypothetical protein